MTLALTTPGGGTSLLRAALVLASIGLGTPAAVATAGASSGRPLEQALLALSARGLKIVFTSNVVRPEMTVTAEPTGSDLRAVLEELLTPHGLTFRDGPNASVVVVPRVETVATAAGAADESIALAPLPIIRDELIVTPSRISLLRDEPVGAFGLSREEILTLPHLGDDFFRALTLLPGATGNDVSAQFHVRGARRDETQIMMDGQELYEAFHLKDYDSALSVVAPATLGSADLITGGFSAEYGDRMSGVLDMTTMTPGAPARFRLGLGILGAHVGGSGAFQEGRGGWIAEVRRGSIDLVGRLLGDEDPHYWDAFGKLDYRLGSGSSVRANLLHSGDELEFQELRDEETKRFETEYRTSYSWLTGQTILAPRLLFETAASLARIDRDRRGLEVEDGTDFAILDGRDTEVAGLRQDWGWAATGRHSLDWGWQVRRFDTAYDYLGVRSFDTPLAQLRHDSGTSSTILDERFRGRHDSVYLADRIALLEPLTLELGLRHDRHTQTRESHLTPRLNLAYAVGTKSVLRAAWGRFHQSQRTYELQVEDGDATFYPVERAEHAVVGFETIVDRGAGSPELALRLEAYRREVANPRPRYENLFEPINTFPEVEHDRVRTAPDRSDASGVELYLRGGIGRRARWWANYTYALTEDDVEGRQVPRLFDQTHAVNVDFDVSIKAHWRLNAAWRYHTGWPTTPLDVAVQQDDEGEAEFVPILGPINSRRLPSYHRLDLRASRRWQLRGATVDVFVDIQNVYNRKNVAGFDFEIDEDDGTLVSDTETWPGILPSAGISIEF